MIMRLHVHDAEDDNEDGDSVWVSSADIHEYDDVDMLMMLSVGSFHRRHDDRGDDDNGILYDHHTHVAEDDADDVEQGPD
eukprot:4032825-Karenia_brevis.AAC.1